MPVPAMAEPVLDHQRRFEAAVDVIHNLPKNGSYRPSYEVMLRFYGLYKQAVCGPCSVPRPGFWDPVGRYKWDAWSCLGQMSSENAMAAYVEEMKKVAQEVIDTMPMNEKTASLFHHFEPLYLVIDDIPRPPDSLLALRDGLNNREKTESPALRTDEHEEHTDTPQELNEQENVQLTANTVPHGGDPQGNARRGPPGAAGGAGRGGGDGSEGGAELLHDAHLQQQIILALRRLREDMRSVMDRLEGVERLAATHAQGAEWSLCRRCADLQEQQPGRYQVMKWIRSERRNGGRGMFQLRPSSCSCCGLSWLRVWFTCCGELTGEAATLHEEHTHTHTHTLLPSLHSRRR
ncbi:acyl-CoA-binding domain-containing protein 4 isoform X4 [Gouania willdenowi]|uniref:acyl-CoA-binding domain-containing protein 4 isoform X4 n=1 Tax=Gouania willdenowi TaxID=441366 RepID=UPI0010548ED9|nr:acyl-CoA-binding domain-containing protein 4 isoform X4 [Gouania willdenowi]